MTKHQGGASTSQAMSVNFPAGRRTKPRPGRLSQLAIPAAISNLGLTLADRKVREIVTVSGRGVRGHFPSYKGKLLQFESLIEEDALRVLNVASSVTSLVTQPCVFAIPGSPRLRYTPDLRATMYAKIISSKLNPLTFKRIRMSPTASGASYLISKLHRPPSYSFSTLIYGQSACRKN